MLISSLRDIVAPHPTLLKTLSKSPLTDRWWPTLLWHIRAFLVSERVTFASFHLLSHCVRLHLLITALTFWQKKWSEGSDQPWPEDSSLEVKGKQKAGTAVWWWTESKWSRPAAFLRDVGPESWTCDFKTSSINGKRKISCKRHTYRLYRNSYRFSYRYRNISCLLLRRYKRTLIK